MKILYWLLQIAQAVPTLLIIFVSILIPSIITKGVIETFHPILFFFGVGVSCLALLVGAVAYRKNRWGYFRIFVAIFLSILFVSRGQIIAWVLIGSFKAVFVASLDGFVFIQPLINIPLMLILFLAGKEELFGIASNKHKKGSD